MKLSVSELQQIKSQLAQDCARTKEKRRTEPDCMEWGSQECWRQYCGHGIGTVLYRAFSDDELLGILRETAAEIGHNPSKKDVFCVYRVFILRRFEKWPWALVAAGLKEPKQKPQRISRQNGKNQAGHIRETNGAAK